MEKAAHALSPLIRRLGLTSGVRLGRIRSEWDALFGPTLSEHMSPSKLTEGELLINIDQPIWMQQLTFHKQQIVGKLKPYGVTKVRFRIGNIYSYRSHGRTETVREMPELSPEDTAFVEDLASGVSDESLRRTIRRAAEKSMRALSQSARTRR